MEGNRPRLTHRNGHEIENDAAQLWKASKLPNGFLHMKKKSIADFKKIVNVTYKTASIKSAAPFKDLCNW